MGTWILIIIMGHDYTSRPPVTQAIEFRSRSNCIAAQNHIVAADIGGLRYATCHQK